MRKIGKVLWMIAGLCGGQALAQEAAPAAKDAQPAAATPAEAAPAPAAPAVQPASPAPQAAATDPILAEKVQTLEKAVAENKGLLDKASNLKISGFVQGRYEWHDDSINGWDTKSNGPASSTKSTFYVRRARLDTLYTGKNAEFVLQFDGGGDTVGLRDAEAAFVDTWTPLHLRISLGQFKYAFGYEIQQSDTLREMPERSRMIQQFFPGERDRGLKVQGRYQMLRFQLSLINGNGIQDPIFKSGKDSNAWVDFVGRVGVDFNTISGGLSWYYGGSSVYNPASSTDTSPLNLKRYSRLRGGADLQANLAVPSLGNLSLRGEFIISRDKNKEYNGVAADSCQDRVGLGWSAIAAQNIGSLFGAVVRVDWYDPLLQSTLDDQKCLSPDGKSGTYITAGMDRVITYGGGLLLNVSQNFKATFVYEHPTEQSSKKIDNDVFTAQLQARF
jgi:hypothetical protein